MSKREFFLVILLTFIGLIAGYYYFVFDKQYNEIVTLEDQLVNVSNQVAVFEVSKRNVSKLEKQKDEIENQLNEVFDGYLSQIEQEEIILLINEILIRSNVEVTNLSFAENSKSELPSIDYSTLNVMISVSGEYQDIINFMSSFWRFDQNIYIENMSLNSDEDELLKGFLNIAFVRLNNEYTKEVSLFEWYEDNFYVKDNPFDETDFTSIFKPNYFYTGTDVEFYNPPYEAFNDIHGHWAEEIINFFGRNGYIVGDEDNNVYPDNQMTRLETMILLDLVFRWELGEDFVALETFDDYAAIASLDDIEKKTLLKAYNSGYLFGYDDNTLRPNNKITYEELGYIGANLLENDQVTWLEVALEIEEKFGYSSTGLVDEKLYATKAEIIYFLSYIDNKEQ